MFNFGNEAGLLNLINLQFGYLQFLLFKVLLVMLFRSTTAFRFDQQGHYVMETESIIKYYYNF